MHNINGTGQYNLTVGQSGGTSFSELQSQVSFYSPDRFRKQTTLCVVRNQNGEHRQFQEEPWDKIYPSGQEACPPARSVTVVSEEDLQPSQR